MYEFTKVINTYRNKSYLYDAYKNSVVKLPEYIENTDYKFTKEYIETKKECYLDLLSKGYFKGKKLDKIDNPMINESKKIIANHLKGLTLQITTNCNFACKYCFISEKYNHKKEPKKMEWSVAEKAIIYFMEHSKEEDSIDIRFYGGEPMLNFFLIKQCVDYIEKNYSDRKYQYYMTTNLSILDDEKLDFFVAHNFMLLISLDGPMLIHNKNRVYKDGADTYDVIEGNLKYIKNKYPKYFRTITFNSVLSRQDDYFAIKDFFLYKNLFRDKDNEINDFIISQLYFADDFENKESKNVLRGYIDYIKNQKSYMKELLISFLVSFNIVKAENKFENQYLNSELVYWLRKFQKDSSKDNMELEKMGHPYGTCFAGSDKLMVDPDGVFWPCEKVNTNNKSISIGNVDVGIDLGQVNKMLNISKHYTKCCTCWCFRYCGQCISSITNSTRDKACNNSRSYIEEKLIHYCNLIEINNECQMIIGSEKRKKDLRQIYESKEMIEAICQYVDISIIEDTNAPIYAAYELYKLIVILTYQYNIIIKVADIIEYNNIKDFITKIVT